MVKPPEPTIHHNSKKYLILLPLKAIYFRSLHYETPCMYRFSKFVLQYVVHFYFKGVEINSAPFVTCTFLAFYLIQNYLKTISTQCFCKPRCFINLTRQSILLCFVYHGIQTLNPAFNVCTIQKPPHKQTHLIQSMNVFTLVCL